MSKKVYAYLLVNENETGITDSWDNCKQIVQSKKARYKSFKDLKSAQEWLSSGAQYEDKKGIIKEQKKSLDKEGIYFDAGTGRGEGVEVRVTDYDGNSLLCNIVPKKNAKKINEHDNYHLQDGETNNYGELLGLCAALIYSIENNKKNIYGDSKLVIEYWSKCRYNKENLEERTIKLIKKVYDFRKQFEEKGGKVSHISGDINPADLGFHK